MTLCVTYCHGEKRSDELVGETRITSGWWCNGHDQSGSRDEGKSEGLHFSIFFHIPMPGRNFA